MTTATFAQKDTVQKDAVLAALDGRYLEFYEAHTPLKQVSGQWRGPCPLHSGSGPNFSVDPATGHWFCHSQCGSGGDVLAFVQRRAQVDFPEALAQVAAWAGVRPSPAAVRTSAEPPSGPFLDPCLAERAHQALMDADHIRLWLSEHRGLTTETLLRFQLGLQLPETHDGPYRITFPVYDSHGRLTNIRRHWFAYDAGVERTSKTLPWAKGLRSDLYPLSALDDRQADVLLVEGEADAVLACQLGFCALTGTLGAGTWKAEWTEALRGRSVTLLYDNDAAGQEGARKTATALAAAGCRVRVASPPVGKDLSEWIVCHGGTAAGVQAALDAAVDFTSSPAVVAGDPPSEPELLPSEALWPQADEALFHGLAGEIVRVIDPHTEADPLALLVQLLTAFGSAIGRSAHFLAEADPHYGNLFVVLVGVSSKGRKGTSWGHIRRLFAFADDPWETHCLQSGLSSGEGLIWHVRDAVEKPVKNKTTGEVELETIDPGVADKRLLVMESEYASVLRVAGRDGNTLSAILRDAWDKGRLQTMTKNSAVKATGAHVSLIGHVTDDELRRELSSTEAGNGFANRFLWICTKRSKELPEGGALSESALYPLATRLSEVIQAGRQRGLLVRDDAARAIWHQVYHDLSAGAPGLSGAVTSRAEAQTMRLALLYALLDGADCIRQEHLLAALALWDYVEASARYVFGDSLGDPVADDILRALRVAPSGLSRTELRELFQRHQPSGRIQQALDLLARHGRATLTMQETGGRPAEHWKAAPTGTKAKTEGAR